MAQQLFKKIVDFRFEMKMITSVDANFEFSVLEALLELRQLRHSSVDGEAAPCQT